MYVYIYIYVYVYICIFMCIHICAYSYKFTLSFLLLAGRIVTVFLLRRGRLSFVALSSRVKNNSTNTDLL